MTDKPLGQLIDSLGVEGSFDEGALVEGVICLFKVVDADGFTQLIQRHSGLGWFERAGMLRQAELIETDPSGYSFGDCED